MAGTMIGVNHGDDITYRLHGILLEELSPLHSTLNETNKSMEGLASKFNSMGTLLNNLCKTVDTLQLQKNVNSDERPQSSGEIQLHKKEMRPKSLSKDGHAMVDHLVSSMENLSMNSLNDEIAKQLKEDNLLLRRNLQAHQDRENHFLSRMNSLEKQITELSDDRKWQVSSCEPTQQIHEDLPPAICSDRRSKSISDLTKPSSKSSPRDLISQPKNVIEATNGNKLKQVVRQQLISPSRTRKAASILRRGSNSSSASTDSGGTSSKSKLVPITPKHHIGDHLQAEIEIVKSDNNFLRKNIQDHKQREDEMYQKTKELENRMLEHARTISILPKPSEGNKMSELKLNINFQPLDQNQITPTAIVAPNEIKIESASEQRKSSGPVLDKGKLSKIKTTSNNENKKNMTNANTKLPDVKNSTKPPPPKNATTNGNSKKPGNGTGTAKTSTKPQGPKGNEKVMEQEDQDQDDIHSDILEFDNWKVTITSKHELETIYEQPNRTIIITPKPPPVEEIKELPKIKAVEKKPKVDPIPTPPQYPCARPPGNYIPSMNGIRSSIPQSGGCFNGSNIAVVSPLKLYL